MKVGKIFASAGCGKTTALINKLEQVFQKGIRPQEVLFTTFTRSGAYEARDRAVAKFDFNPDHFLFFRTLHSICFRALQGPKIMSRQDYYNLGRTLKVKFGSAGMGEDLHERGKGDALLALYNLQRNMMSEEDLNPSIYGLQVPPNEYRHFIETYENYRNERGLCDYTDMIAELSLDESFDSLPVKYAFIDEAQDLTRLQYSAVQKLVGNAREIWYAGDDDQCIFSYSGADPEILINMESDDQVMLNKSYRLPVPVANYANTVAERVKIREPKKIEAFYDTKIETNRLIYSNAWYKELDLEKSTTILCRNRSFFGYFEEHFHQQGILYSFVKPIENEENIDKKDMDTMRIAINTWKALTEYPDKPQPILSIKKMMIYIPSILFPQKFRRALVATVKEEFSYNQLIADYGLLAQNKWQKTLSLMPYHMSIFLEAVEKKNNLQEEPKVRIGTIHSFKGKEDDDVIVLPDMSWITYKNYIENPDSENRVFYVGVTRAKERLILLQPITKYFYRW